MQEGDLTHLMSELKTSADTLQQESQSVQGILQDVEEQLCALNLDMELWLENAPLSIRDLSVNASNVAPHMELQLGFARQDHGSGGTWRLQLREAEYAPYMHDPDEPERKLMRVHKVTPLAAASREDLIAAVAKLPSLLAAFTEATRARIAVIREARELLDR